MTDDIEVKPRANKLRGDRMQFAQQHFLGYDVAAEAGTVLEDLLRPAWWANVAGRLRRLSLVNVVPEDGGFFAQVIVTDVGTGFAKVAIVNHVDLDPSDDEASDEDFEVKWQGPHTKWAVMRRADSTRLREGFTNKQDAETWMREHKQVIGR